MSSIYFPRLVAPLGFYAVVPTASWVKKCIDAGVHTVQLRNKDLTGDALKAEVQACVNASEGSQTQLFINDYWQLAIECGAYGVHLGQEDMDVANLQAIAHAGVRLGLSTHSVDELDRALSVNPSYVACGPIYETTTKKMAASPRGLERLSQYVVQAGDTPTVAIGGIDLERIDGVLSTGVSSVAVVRGITEASDYLVAIEAFKSYFK